MVGKLVPGVTGYPLGATPSPVRYPVYPSALGVIGISSAVTSVLLAPTVVVSALSSSLSTGVPSRCVGTTKKELVSYPLFGTSFSASSIIFVLISNSFLYVLN